ncbi:ABC transporter permease [Chromobacterium haemolyticum]|uniref:ABC transporter permease n=1 Tax=Chromobacterium haemolyticum TaxID=394935 RepID=UPI004055901E
MDDSLSPKASAFAARLPGRAGWRAVLSRYGIVAALLLLCVLLSLASPYFLSWDNWANILRQTSINGILAVGMTFVILSRGIDLSVGAVLAFAGMVAASLAIRPEAGVAPALLAGLGCGLALGAVNGLLVARLAVPSFVATLGMLSAARGLTYIYSDGMPVSSLPDGFRLIGQGEWAGLPLPVLIFALVAALAWFTLSHTVFGRYVYAVGGNEKSARTSGIRTRWITFCVYLIAGGLSGLAGLILTARTTAALPQAGVAYELDAIAAVVIGGASLSGGVGSVIGTVMGALIIGVINNGLDLMGVSSYYQQLIKGVIIVAAVLLDGSRHRQA